MSPLPFVYISSRRIKKKDKVISNAIEIYQNLKKSGKRLL